MELVWKIVFCKKYYHMNAQKVLNLQQEVNSLALLISCATGY